MPRERDEVQAVNRTAKLFLMAQSGAVGVLEAFFGSDGCESAPEDAVAAVGRLSDTEWYAIDLRQFEPAAIH
jgi:hypothetical protein